MPFVRWMASAPPKWWRNGWPRERPGSVAEAELLSQLGCLLKPRTPLAELFRRFPATEGWGGHYLEPDLSVHGVLPNDAALFVEYDGYWRHREMEGVSADRRKNAALLAYAPPGSLVVRISHTASGYREGSVLWIAVGQWRSGDQKSIWKALKVVLVELITKFHGKLRPDVAKRLQTHADKDFMPVPLGAEKFVRSAAVVAGGSTPEEISDFWASHGLDVASQELGKPHMYKPHIAVEKHLRPCFRWLISLGLTKSEIERVLSTFPQVLSCRIEQNLKPTVSGCWTWV